MATVTIPDSTYRRLQDAAAAERMPVDKYLDQVLRDRGETAREGNRQALDPASPEWRAAFEEWIAIHKDRKEVADDSRDAIYGDERD